MEVIFTPEQETEIAQMANLAGVPPDRLVRDAALQLIRTSATSPGVSENPRSSKVCPECGHRFKGKGWDGIDAEDLFVAERRLAGLRTGRSRTHSLQEVEHELGLAD